MTKWHDASELSTGQLVVSPWGIPKSGKTHFAFTFPEPIRVINFDFGIKEVVGKFPGKDIKWADFLITAEPDQHHRILGEAVEAYEDMLDELKGSGGTIVIDTITQVWQLVQSVKLETVKNRRAKKKGVDVEDVQIHQFDYSQANLYMGSMLRSILDTQYSKVNGVFIMRSKKQYAGGDDTGKQEFQGFNETPSIAQITLEILMKGGARVTSNRFDRATEGMVFGTEGDPMGEISYDYLREMWLE
jgi:hypothetical protein